MNKQFVSQNPATEAIIAHYPGVDKSTLLSRLDACEQARQAWLTHTLPQKKEVIQTLIQRLKTEETRLAMTITEEMGKPITQARAEIQKCALLCEYYLQEAERFLSPDDIPSAFTKSQRHFEPIGLILGIMPWNFPIWQVFRFAIPNLLLGNGILLKPAPNVTGCGLAIERLMCDAQLPNDLFCTLIVDVPLISTVIQSPLVQGVTLTGSQRAGRAVAQEAGQVLKKVVLELGGNDPYLILEDADIELAATACVQSRLLNAGQVCIAAKRILVHKTLKPTFEKIILQKMSAYVMADPADPNTTLGPMARDDLRQTLHQQVERTLQAGAICLTGGEIPQRTGFYYPPTCLTNVPVDSPVFTEELFGPVLCITEVSSNEEAVELANHSEFGLGGAVFSQSVDTAFDVAKQLNIGSCAINTFVASDPKLPFGGMKQSGFGRELSMEGMREFANIKTIVVK